MKNLIFLAVLSLTCYTVTCDEVVDEPSIHQAEHTGEGTAAIREKLYKHLTQNYQKAVNPDKPDVKLGISLIDVDIDESRSTLEANLWLKFIWHDNRLKWDSTEYPVSLLRLDYETFWHPDIALYNSADLSKSADSCWESKVLVYNTGNVLWVPPCHFSAFCKTTLAEHPYDEQTCFLKFGSWTYNSNMMDLNFYNNQTSIDLTDFWDMSNWSIVSNSAVKNVKYYSCCPEPYADLMFNMTLKRKPKSESLCSA